MSPLIAVPEHITQALLIRPRVRNMGRRGENMSPCIGLPDHITQALLISLASAIWGRQGENMSPLIAVPDHVTQALLIRPRVRNIWSSRREYVSMHQPT